MHVLFITPWYPNRYDAMDGLFVRKHAQAVARLERVSVIRLHSDTAIRDFEIETCVKAGVYEVIVYYPISKTPILSAISKAVNFLRAMNYAYNLVEERCGHPDVVQVNVLTRCGVAAWWLKRKYNIPYVVVEHWTRYLPENYGYKGFIRHRLTEMVCRNASCLMPVSDLLGEAMRSHGIKCSKWHVINNVVDDFFFDEDVRRKPHTKKRFVNVTCFLERAKNISGILRVVKQLSLRRSDFELVMVGTGKDFDAMLQLYQSLDFPDGVVRFTGEQTPEEVCGWLRESDFMLLFSNYENAPVVISEAFAVGKPIVSSRVGFVEKVVSAECGIVVEPRDEEQLLVALDKMLDTCDHYDKEKIRAVGRQFSYDAVGKDLLRIYKEAIRENKS